MAKTRIKLNAAEEQARSQEETLELSTAEIGLTVRTTNCLEEKGIFTVRDLVHCDLGDLFSISNFGSKTAIEVFRAIKKAGIHVPDHLLSEQHLEALAQRQRNGAYAASQKHE